MTGLKINGVSYDEDDECDPFGWLRWLSDGDAGETKHIVDLFGLMGFIPRHAGAKADLGIVVGHFTWEDLQQLRKDYDKIIIGGACANESYLDLLESCENSGEMDAADGKSLRDDVYRVKGCPVSTDELIYTIHCLKDGMIPKHINYPICKECKEKENVCLLKEGKRCYGTVTAAGCGAKCPSMRVPCRGCRGKLPNAKTELLEKLFVKYEKTSGQEVNGCL